MRARRSSRSRGACLAALPDQTWVITRHGVVLGVCTTATAAALKGAIPDLAFTPISREVLARDAAWSLADGACKDLTIEWGRWENTYAAALTQAARLAALAEPAAVCWLFTVQRG